ncbi:replication associated protein [Lactobacillus sp. ESL0228]|uniref:replication associated protein n=1 Tax=Lactobacillus sp. ESL0228 TaxID=2069352 RepID=UPI000EFD5774|nr:replication associated protein [Lactobacillus sp. ESL0228]RMC50933.1 replication associated protein [Lactobacillus sp. ESL0228]
MRQVDPNWNNVFKKHFSEGIDSERSPAWKYIVDQLIEGKRIPSYFKPHLLHAKLKLIKQIKKGLGNPAGTPIKIIDIHLNGQTGNHLLIYSQSKTVVYLVAIGTHSELF